MSSTAWSNDYLVECLCNRSVYQIPVTGVSQIHLILNFNLTIPNIKIYGNGLPSFFFQRWTIIKYRHIGIFYNHLGKKKTYGVDSHKLCPIFLHKKHYDLLQSNTTPTKRIRNIWRTTLNRNAPSLPVVYTKLDENDNMIIENLI